MKALAAFASILCLVAFVAAGVFFSQKTEAQKRLARATEQLNQVNTEVTRLAGVETKLAEANQAVSNSTENARAEARRGQELQAQIQQSSGSNAALTAKLAEASLRETALMQEFQSASNSAATLAGLLTNANNRLKELAPAGAPARTVPVTVSLHKIASSPGLILQFRNTLDRLIAIDVMFTRAGSSRNIRFDIPASGIKEIGPTDGWSAVAGDKVELLCDGYQPVVLTVKAQ